MKTVAVTFLWHLHQPYYTDPLTHIAPFPLVRLHATKGYFDMGVLLEEYPGMQATVNLTPSLLLQLQEQEQGRVRDVFLSHAARPAADLSEEERAFILRHFFAANLDTMVRPHERYYSLLIQRGRRINGANLSGAYSTAKWLPLGNTFPRSQPWRSRMRGSVIGSASAQSFRGFETDQSS